MPTSDRRHFLAAAGAATGALALLGLTPDRLAALRPAAIGRADMRADLSHFPQQDPALVRECVSVAHRDLERLRDLVEAHPALATASLDWGYGDWETPLGAASHVGQREIAEYLLTRGARMNLFTATMLGQLELVRAFVVGNPGIQRTTGPHGITLYNHARAGRESAAAVRSYLESLGDANPVLPVVPLESAQYAPYLGTYQFGPLDGDRIFVTETRQMLQIGRETNSAKTIFHLGAHTFRPGGAPAVRIRFEVQDDRAAALTVIDHEPVVTARRVDA